MNKQTLLEILASMSIHISTEQMYWIDDAISGAYPIHSVIAITDNKRYVLLLTEPPHFPNSYAINAVDRMPEQDVIAYHVVDGAVQQLRTIAQAKAILLEEYNSIYKQLLHSSSNKNNVCSAVCEATSAVKLQRKDKCI